MVKNYIILNAILSILTSQTLLGMSCVINQKPISSIPTTNGSSLGFTSNDCLAVLADTFLGIGFNIYSPTSTSCSYNNEPGTIFGQQGSTEMPLVLAVSRGNCLAYADGTGRILIYSSTCPGCAVAQTNTLSLSPTAMGFSNNNCLVVGDANGNINIYTSSPSSSCNYTSSAPSFTIPSGAQVNVIASSPSMNNCLAIGDVNGNVYIYSGVSDCTYNTTTPQTIALGGVINDIAFSGSDCLAIADNSGRVTTYKPGVNCTSYTLATTISGLAAPSSLAFSPSECLAIGNNDGSVGLYSSINNCMYNTTATSSIKRNGNQVSSIAFSFSNPACLAVAFKDAINIYSFSS